MCVVDVWSLVFSADSRLLATGSHNGKINLFSVEEGNKQSVLDTRGKFIMSIAYVSGSHIPCYAADVTLIARATICQVPGRCVY